MAMVTLRSPLGEPLQPRCSGSPAVPSRHAAGRNRFTTGAIGPLWCTASTALVQRFVTPLAHRLFTNMARAHVRHGKRPFHRASIDVD